MAAKSPCGGEKSRLVMTTATHTGQQNKEQNTEHQCKLRAANMMKSFSFHSSGKPSHESARVDLSPIQGKVEEA